jgi:hypothetical protein
MSSRDNSLRLQAEGFWNDAGISSHTNRSVHAQKRDTRHQQLLYRMARFVNSGTHRNALWLQTCKRTIKLFFVAGEKRK